MRRDVARILVVPLAAGALAWLAATGAGLGQTGRTDPNQPPPHVGTTDANRPFDPNRPPEPNAPIDSNQPVDPNEPNEPSDPNGPIDPNHPIDPNQPTACTAVVDPNAPPPTPSLWRIWTASGDLTAARLQALHWWMAADGVAAAVLVPPEPPDLHVLFEGAVDPEIVSLRAPQEEVPGPWRDEYLAELAAEIEHRLGHGGLLVVEDEGLSFAPPLAASAEAFAAIEAAATLPDEASRFAALREVVPDDRMARSIAPRFTTSIAREEVTHAQD